DLVELFESQLLSRELDYAARALRRRDVGYYTIGSAGHEGNAVLGRLARPTDPAFLHYRSGALVLERGRHDPTVDGVRDTLLGMVAARDEPIAGGRHKVWGSRPLWIVPQTSTIASHLPKAVGTAVALGRGTDLPIPRDSIVLCSFGDASANHSTATGAFNLALWTARQKLPVPVLFVCEDNGLGISVPTPEGWIEARLKPQFGDGWFAADGCDLADAWRAARAAVDHCRRTRRPTFLHLSVVRLLGHAGSDVESAYRDAASITSDEARDPLLASARLLFESGARDAAGLRALWDAARERVAAAAEAVIDAAPLASRAEVMAPLAPHSPDAVSAEATRNDFAEARERAWGDAGLPETGPPRHLAVQINRALTDLLAQHPEALLFGEDVARKGGVYHVTPGLQARFGPRRVFDTLLDEQSILGVAQGAALLGALPFPEIQYLAYLHNAIDQLRGEAASLQFFSRGQFRNPMVVRIAGLGYQKGFGGHFHNDNGLAALREIPGLVIACPSRGDDAAGMLRTCAALAKVDGRVVTFVEPIALYMTRDLHAPGDGLWESAYPPPGEAVPFGAGRVWNEAANDLLLVTYGNGVPMALRAARTLEQRHGIAARILDLRWLAPLDHETIATHAHDCGRVLVLDEGRRSGGIGEGVVTGLVEAGCGGLPIRLVAGADSYQPLGPAAGLVLPSEGEVVDATVALCGIAK
ncbi:MAG: transketolase C-terminal domain-containing protein, partial [Gammaproteobacteria bacterium]|nr:transketolase C-terminal domain-containing protein [Gammaproteobacteria bacterium]